MWVGMGFGGAGGLGGERGRNCRGAEEGGAGGVRQCDWVMGLMEVVVRLWWREWEG